MMRQNCCGAGTSMFIILVVLSPVIYSNTIKNVERNLEHSKPVINEPKTTTAKPATTTAAKPSTTLQLSPQQKLIQHVKC